MGPGAAAGVEQAQQRAALRRALARLPVAWREVVELHWFEELSYPELARRLGGTPGAARIRAHRAYQRLRELLAQEHTDEA